MDMFTNQPSVVLYSAIYLDGVTRKGGNGCYVPHSALAIEHQAPADAINKPEFGVNVVRTSYLSHSKRKLQSSNPSLYSQPW
jgi:galactose mutarotase-like enzyme